MITYVYFIRRSDGAAKIGVSKNPGRRVKQLQTGSNRQLTVVAKFPFASRKEALEVERVWHRKCASLRQEGEWFDGRILRRIKHENLVKRVRHLKSGYNSRIKEITEARNACMEAGNTFLRLCLMQGFWPFFDMDSDGELRIAKRSYTERFVNRRNSLLQFV